MNGAPGWCGVRPHLRSEMWGTGWCGVLPHLRSEMWGTRWCGVLPHLRSEMWGTGWCGVLGSGDGLGKDGSGLAPGAGVGREVAHGGGDGVHEESATLEVHAVAGELACDLAEGALNVGAGVEVFEQEGLVFDDGEDAVGAVVVAHHLVVHGGGAAAGAVLFGVVHALVGFGGFAVHGFVVGHGGLFVVSG